MKNRRIALLVESSTAFGRGALRGVAAYARDHPEWELLYNPGAGGTSVRQLAQWAPHGLLVRALDRRSANRITQTGIPAIDLGFTIPDMFPWSLTNDQHNVGRVAGEHLLARGFRHFAFCGWGPADPAAKVWEQQRLRSFRATVGGSVSVYRWPSRVADRQWIREQKRLATWLSDLPKPVGLFAVNDLRASHLLSACRLAGISVPREIGLIGVDDDELICEVSSPTLSSVKLNFEGIGRHGAELLDGLLDGREPDDETLRFPPLGITARQSTDVVATDDELVIQAVRMMSEQMADGIDVAGVTNALPLSRKALELRFKHALGTTPFTELTRLRMERARQLLSQANKPIKSVAMECGFRHLQNFYAAFAKSENMTPAEFRKTVK